MVRAGVPSGRVQVLAMAQARLAADRVRMVLPNWSYSLVEMFPPGSAVLTARPSGSR
jgi:hypothetical protein